MTLSILYFKRIILAVMLKIHYKGTKVGSLWSAGRSPHSSERKMAETWFQDER